MIEKKMLPNGFDYKTYLELNDDLKDLTEKQAIYHYLNYGKKENREYKSNNIIKQINIYITSKNWNYSNNFKIINDISTLKPQESCIFILDDFIIDELKIKNLYEEFISTNADILSPTICDLYQKMIYCGGIVLNNSAYFFSEKDIELNKFVQKRNFVKNTTLIYPGFFITNNIKYLANYKDYLDAFSHYSKNYHANDIIKTTPFSIITKKTNENYIINNISLNNFESFYFEKENIKDFLKTNNVDNTHSIKMQNFNYLDNNKYKYILFCDNSIIKKDEDCGSLYIYNFIKVLIKLKYNIHFFSHNCFYDKDYTSVLQKMGINTIFGEPFCLHEFLKNNQSVYDYIFVNRSELFTNTYDIIKKYSNKSKLVFITHDLIHLRECKEDIKYNELENIKKSDLSLIVSNYEYEYLRSLNYNNIYYYPICYENNENVLSSINNTKDFYFIGSSHPPNIEAITYFLDNVFEKILNIMPDLKMFIIGKCCNYLGKYKKQFNESIQLCGLISEETLISLQNSLRINIVPLLSGGGLKGKIIEGLNKGIPIISSTKGVEGFNLTHLNNIILLDYENNDYELYAKKFIDYYNNLELLELIRNNGKKYFINNLSNEKSMLYCKKMFDILDTCSESNSESSESNSERICVLYQTYNNNDLNNKFLKKYFDNFSKYIFDIYIIINNEYSFKETIINNVDDKLIYIKGDNSSWEFTAYKSGVDYLKNSNKMNNYSAFIITNETINKNHPIFLNDIIPETFDYAVNNNCCLGRIDSKGSTFTIEGMTMNNWIRSNFFLFNKNIFIKISDKIIYFDNKTNIQDININNNIKHSINNWINFNERYKNLNESQKKIKFKNILNEFILSYNIGKYGKIIDLRKIKKYSYNFFDSNYNLKFDMVPYNNNWYDINEFLKKKQEYLLK
jgi:hypothetical protein